MLSHASSSVQHRAAHGLCICLCDHPQHGMHIGPYTEFAFPYTGSSITHGMRAALAGCRDRPQQPVSRTTSPRRRVTGTGEPYPPLARMYCPQARACAHPHAARMCALRFCALPALPACVVAVLTLCACVVRRRAMWRKRACKAAGWGCGLQLVRAGTGRSVCVLV